MILQCHAYVTVNCHVSVRSAVLRAYLNPFVHTRTMWDFKLGALRTCTKGKLSRSPQWWCWKHHIIKVAKPIPTVNVLNPQTRDLVTQPYERIPPRLQPSYGMIRLVFRCDESLASSSDYAYMMPRADDIIIEKVIDTLKLCTSMLSCSVPQLPESVC